VPVTQFYALKRKERAKLVHEQLAQAQDIPRFYANTGRKRPALLSRPATRCLPPAGRCWLVGCCGRVGAGARAAAGVGDGVMGSRLALGMHWPLDLIVATLISWLLDTGLLACAAALRPAGQRDIKKG
jgi:phosphatidylglycerophosphatase B